MQVEVSLGEQFSKGTGKDRKVFGHQMRIKIAKNKIAPPLRQASLDLYYDFGVDKITELVNVAKEVGVLQGTSWLTLVNPGTGELCKGEDGKDIKWNGMSKTTGAIQDDIKDNDGELYNTIYDYVQEVIRG